jgi:hypothetical protein
MVDFAAWNSYSDHIAVVAPEFLFLIKSENHVARIRITIYTIYAR